MQKKPAIRRIADAARKTWTCRGQNIEHDATTHYQCLSPVAASPDCDRGVRDEDHKQQQAQLTDEHPRIRHPLGDRDGFAKERDVPQTGDLAVVEILPNQEIEQQR